ncbi:type II toxin-antitoxin system RelE/ParE family toxin [Sphingomonas sp. PB2P19]|uniref:type II toxin-antitoxin system RelE/ParE family toxin n=1 Tax=Sphingomonas rhamnosi TaxID=3096156 RepID=UPI003FA6EB9A
MQIGWTTPALADLRGINRWPSSEADPDFAVRTLVAIRLRSRFLVDFPRAGRPHRGGQRILWVFGTPYLIRYRIAGELGASAARPSRTGALVH